MSEGETYLFVFNTKDSNVLSNVSNGNTNVTFNVNWPSYLPTKYNKFKCSVSFKSEMKTVTTLDANTLAFPASSVGSINFNCGSTNIYQNNNLSSNIAMVYPVVNYYSSGTISGVVCNYSQSFYRCDIGDNPTFFLKYPTNNVVTIKLLTLSGSSMSFMMGWCMFLSMTGIIEENE